MLGSILERGLDNLRFALDGYVPEHIIDELRSRQEFTNGDEGPRDMTEFSSNVATTLQKYKRRNEQE